MWKNKSQPRRVKGIPRMKMKRILRLTIVLQEQRAPSLRWNVSEGSRREFFRKIETNRILGKCIKTNTNFKVIPICLN